MILQLKSLDIKNLKGISSLKVQFNPVTNIHGQNRAGKTTIIDAVMWLLFGKDSKGKSDFSIKPYDKNNKTIPKLETEVYAVFYVDDKELRIKKTRREDWTKKRGELNTTLTGHTNFFDWNDNNIPPSEFETRRNNLIGERLFRLVTNPLYFNSKDIASQKVPDWQVRRNMLTDLVGEVSIKSKFSSLTPDELTEKRQTIKSQIKKLKDELKLIPIRIDQSHKLKPDTQDWTALFNKLSTKQSELTIVENQIIDKSKVLTSFNEGRAKEQTQLAQHKSNLELCQSDFELKGNIKRTEVEQALEDNNKDTERTINENKSMHKDIETAKTTLEYHEKQKKAKYKEFDEWNNKKFTSDICGACGQQLPEMDLKKAKDAFEFEVENNLTRINSEGKQIAERMGELSQKIKNLELELKVKGVLDLNATKSRLETELAQIAKPNIEEFNEYRTLKHTYDEAKKAFDKSEPPQVNTKDLTIKKELIKADIDELKKALEVKTQIADIDAEIKILEEQESAKSLILVDLEKTEFEIEDYVKEKVKALESLVNAKFKHVSFKMFEEQINGGQKEVCTCLVNGVPFNDVNTEGQINGGLDIINVFSEFYKVSAPIFIDNRESITEIIETKSQVINFIVDPEFKTLQIM